MGKDHFKKDSDKKRGVIPELKAEDVQSNWESIMDQVQKLYPIIIERKKQNESRTFLLNEKLVQQLLQSYSFTIVAFPEEDSSITVCVDELELYANGKNKETAVENLIEDILEYAIDFFGHPERYLKAPNRRHHFPYLLKVLMCKNSDQIKQMLMGDAK